MVAQTLDVTKDPRLPSSVTEFDLVQQYELARDIQAERVRVAVALDQAAQLRTLMATAREARNRGALSSLDELSRAIDRAAGPPPPDSGEEYSAGEADDPTTLRQLAASLSGLQSVVESADAAPTSDAMTGFSERRKLVSSGLDRWQRLLATELPKANKALERAGRPPMSPTP